MARYQLTTDDDTISGTDGADTFDGYAADDGLGATGGVDDLRGLGGDDLFLIQTDTVVTSGLIDGGDGNDTVSAYGFDLGQLSFTDVETLSLEAAEFSATIAQLTSFETVTSSTATTLTFYLTGAGGTIDAGALFASGKSADLNAIGLGSGYAATGTGGRDSFVNSNFDDTVHGGGGADTMSGVHQDGRSGGTDLLFGDAGADTFQLRLQSGTIDGGAGVDTVVAYQSNFGFGLRLGDLGDASFVNVERLVAGPNVTYATLAQLNSFAKISGGDAENLIRFDLSGGAGGAIDFSGMLAEGDRIWLRAHEATSAVELTGAGGDDVLSGSDFRDLLTGGAGDDYLEGASFSGGPGGRDTLIGGEGDDVYYVNGTDRLVELVGPSGGVDTVVSTGGFDLEKYPRLEGEFENLTLSGYLGAENPDTNGYGNGLDNVITGNGGDNLLDGRAGADTLIGGSGDDTYVVDNLNDVVRESDRRDEGVDLVRSSVDFDLADGTRVTGFVENLTLTGDADIGGFGTDAANRITGNAGANVLDGRGGADTMAGGAGHDIYYVDATGDRVIEAAGGGIDTVYASSTFSLAGQSAENLYLTGFDSLRATGNALANVIVGNDGNNAIRGGGGNDTLTGGAGADSFAFNTQLGDGNIDHVMDFETGVDRIRLNTSVFSELGDRGRLDDGAFAFTSDGVATEAGHRIVYNSSTGALFYDADGSGAGAAVRFAMLSIGLTGLNASDFVVA